MFSHRTEWKLAPNPFTQAQREVSAGGADVLDLTVSNPTRAELYYDSETILGSLASAQAMDYDPQPKGLLGAREAVASYYREGHEVFDLDPENIILTTSTAKAILTFFVCSATPGTNSSYPS